MKRLERILSSVDLRGVHALLDWGERTGTRSFQADLADKRDEHSALGGLDGCSARSSYESGLNLRIRLTGRDFHGVSRLLAGLTLELGLPPGTDLRCLAYCTPAGAGTSPHFDANANIVLQLVGRKEWRIARNRHVVNPTERYALNMERIPRGMTRYAPRFPRRMPRADQVIRLEPGSVLFVPRGWWHRTAAIQDSLSAHVVAPQPSWAAIVTSGLRRLLELDPRWRALATGIASLSPERQHHALNRLGELIRDLGERLDQIRPTELARAASRGAARDELFGPARYARDTAATLRIDGTRVVVERADSSRCIELREAWPDLVDHVLTGAEPFSVADLHRALPRIPIPELELALVSLSKAGAIVPVDDAAVGPTELP